MNNKIHLSPVIYELESSSDIYMTLKMIICTSNVNLNGAKFTEDFINGVIDNQQNFIGIPLVVNRTKLENEVFDNLSHEFDGNELKTDMIGSFVSFSKAINNDGSLSLVGEARVMKRYPKTCEAIIQLYQDDKLRFSCEVLVYEYGAISEDGTREIPYAEGKNALFANAIVTSPAEPKAKAMLLVAEALEEDLKQGGQVMSNELFNKGVEIKFYGTIENNALSFEDVSKQIYKIINMDADGNGLNKAYICETYPDHVILQGWEDETLFSSSYIMQDDKVILQSEDQWVKGKYVFTPFGHMSMYQEEYDKLIEEVNTLKEQTQVLAEKEQQLQEKNETLITLNTKIEALQSEIDTLLPIREKYEEAQEQVRLAELAEKQNALRTYAVNSKVITENEFEDNAELIEAIEDLNEVFVKSLIADRIVNQTKETPDKDNVQVSFNLEGKNLIPEGDLKSQLYQPRKK